VVPDRGHALGRVADRPGHQGADRAVNRKDIWRSAARLAGVAAGDMPASTSRGTETFFDGHVFDPAKPADYLAGHSIKKIA